MASKQKADLRDKLKSARLMLSDAERVLASRAIDKKLQSCIDWTKIKTLHYFEPIHELMEPDISDFLTYIEDNYPDIKLFTPRKIEGKWELVSVKGGEVPTSFDVIIVPTLGFDGLLNRLGYGSGYYDRFLSTQQKAQKIGVCYEAGLLPKGVPIEPHDIPLNMVVTDKKVH